VVWWRAQWMVWWRAQWMAPEQGGTLPRKDTCSLVIASTIDSWDAFIVSPISIWTIFCVGYLSR